ncbi:MAG: glycosyl hydrolase family 28-related protein [Candidatus Sumerlaeota bacterium]|nr:glycosyl hydrolase family 28-related protein [Candidatus Sumerlaeota bacterium]
MKIRLHLMLVGCLTLGMGRLVDVPAETGDGPAREWNVAAAGAVGDGQQDCTAIFQRLLDEAGQAGGGVVQVPAGRYRIEGTLTIPGCVTLEGTFRSAPSNFGSLDRDVLGSMLLALAGRGAPDGPPFITLGGPMATLSGLIIYYPEFRQADVPPIPYPPCVSTPGKPRYPNVAILDCLFLNPYEAIRLVGAGRHLVRNVTGYPIRRGLYIDDCTDIGRVENVHFWPFGLKYRADDPFCLWVNTNGVAFEFARTDWQYVANTFCFGYGVGYKFAESEKGSCNGNFLGIGADSCQRAVVVEQTKPQGLLITNGEFVGRWGSTDSVCLEIDEKASGKVSLANCSFWGPIDRCVWNHGDAIQFTAGGCAFVNWDQEAAGSPAIQIDAGKAIIQGSTFDREGALDVLVGPKARSVILMGNQATGGVRVDNRIGDRLQMVANEEDSVKWPDEARLHYRIEVGVSGDYRYLDRWQGSPKNAGAFGDGKPYRWSSASSELVLPVRTGTPYTLALRLYVPETAMSEDAGLYLGGERLAQFEAGDSTLRVDLPATDKDVLRLEARCRGWRPNDNDPKNRDARLLGIRLYSVEMRARDAGEAVFNANTGEWR